MNVSFESRLPMMVPLLPLDGHVLLPAAATPYRVSDPRHRRLVQDLLDRPATERWVAVPLLGRASSAPTVEDDGADDENAHVAALGLITVATPLEGGEYIVVVEGRSACRIEALELGTHPYALPYAVATILPLVDRAEPLRQARDATTALIQALFALYESFGLGASELPQSEQALDDIGIVYRIGSGVIEDPTARAALLCERCPMRRREMVLVQIVDQMAFAMREGLLGRQAPRC